MNRIYREAEETVISLIKSQMFARQQEMKSDWNSCSDGYTAYSIINTYVFGSSPTWFELRNSIDDKSMQVDYSLQEIIDECEVMDSYEEMQQFDSERSILEKQQQQAIAEIRALMSALETWSS